MRGGVSLSRRSNKKAGVMWIVPILASVMLLCIGTTAWLFFGSPDGGYDIAASFESLAQSLFAPRELSDKSDMAAAKLAVKENKTPLYNMEINAAVTHSAKETYYNVIINSDKVTLKNKTVVGDLIIDKAVGKGTVTLQSIVVRGKIIVGGGAKINLDGVTAVTLISKSGCTTLYNVSGDSAIHKVIANNSIIIDESGLKNGYQGIKTVAVKSGEQPQKVTLKSGTIEQTTYEEKIPKEKTSSSASEK